MIKYLKYFISPITIVLTIYICSMGTHYPSVFFVCFSLLIILGDIYCGQNVANEKFNYPILLNLSLYINLPLLFIFLTSVIYVFGNNNAHWLTFLYYNFFNIDIVIMKDSLTVLDRISLIAISSLYIGTMGTVPGHELTHRKRNKFDMFIGNWLLAFSWDCAFAIEHVYGHHKNVCLPNDPASAKRGENIYTFIIRAIFSEQRDAWIIEIDRLKRRNYSLFGIHNKMIIGYIRSIIISLLAFTIGGTTGLLFYLICAFLGKSLLEIINYTEHYGLVRVPGKPVFPRHSWNSNSLMSSIYLYNVTRHSSHHETSNLQYWELETYQDAPTMPQGYLSMIYLLIFFPYFYHKLMAKKLIEWDEKYATSEEKNIALLQNKNSGISFLKLYS